MPRISRTLTQDKVASAPFTIHALLVFRFAPVSFLCRMLKKFILICFLFVSKAAGAQRPDSVSLLIDSALNVMQHRALNSHKLDWKSIRARVDAETRNARTDREAFTALAWAFDQLGDKHGWLTINDSTHNNKRIKRAERTLSPGLKAALAKGRNLYNGIVAGKYAYVSIHFFMGQTEEKMNAYARQIRDSLCKNITPQTRGIIIDLRLNGGGNSFPMYQGLANVYGNRLLTEGVDGRGRRTGTFGIRNGRVTIHGNHGDSIVLAAPQECGALSELPVAVLISPATGSSAEQLAIAFTSRPRSIIIGERSAGYVTANNGFALPGRNNGIVVAEGLTRNRNGKLFPEDVWPDIEVVGGDDFTDREKDAKVRAAVKWLQAQPHSSKRK
jgi:carboxyl-terminal processing protease